MPPAEVAFSTGARPLVRSAELEAKWIFLELDSGESVGSGFAGGARITVQHRVQRFLRVRATDLTESMGCSFANVRIVVDQQREKLRNDRFIGDFPGSGGRFVAKLRVFTGELPRQERQPAVFGASSHSVDGANLE